MNLLSRIDEITKLPKFRETVRESDLVLCPTTAHLLGHLELGCTMVALELEDIGARIRDFEEMRSLWLLPTTLENQAIIKRAQEYVDSNQLLTSSYAN